MSLKENVNNHQYQVDLANNVTFSWDGAQLGVDMPENFQREYPDYEYFGLIGAFNNNTDDDFMSPDGEVKKSAVEFGNSWEVPGSCPDEQSQKRGTVKPCYI